AGSAEFPVSHRCPERVKAAEAPDRLHPLLAILGICTMPEMLELPGATGSGSRSENKPTPPIGPAAYGIPNPLRLPEPVAPNASNVSASLADVSLYSSRSCEYSLPQLWKAFFMSTGAAEKAVSRQNGGSHQPHSGETAYEFATAIGTTSTVRASAAG